MTWRAYIKLLIGFTLVIALVWFSQPQLLRAWAWFTYHYYPANSLGVPNGFDLQPRHFVSCRNHSTFVNEFLGRHVFRHGTLPYDKSKTGEEVFCQIDFDGMGENCHHGAPNQRHGGWQMINASEAVWDKILQGMPDEQIPVLWCGRTHKSSQGDKRIVICIDNTKLWGESEKPYTSFQAFREAEVTMEYSPSAFDIYYGMPETELVAKLKRVNAILQAEGLPASPIDVEGRPSYWNLAAPFQNVPPVQPKPSP
jgi:hypothetical protein